MLTAITEKTSTALHKNTTVAWKSSHKLRAFRNSTVTVWSLGLRGKRKPQWPRVIDSLSLGFSKHCSNISPSLLTSRMTCCSSSCSMLLWISSTEGTRGTLSSLCSTSGLESASSSELSTCCPAPALTGGVGVKATDARYNFLLWPLDFPISSDDPTPAFLPAWPEHTEEESEFPWENTDSVPSAGRVSSPRSPSPKPSSDLRNDCSRISSET